MLIGIAIDGLANLICFFTPSIQILLMDFGKNPAIETQQIFSEIVHAFLYSDHFLKLGAPCVAS